MKKKSIVIIAIAVILVAVIVLTAILCSKNCSGYEPDYTYDPINVGELPAPVVDRSDPSFRTHYPTLEPYSEPVTITVAAVQYTPEAGVKQGTTPENQAFNQIAKKYLNIELKYTTVAVPTVYDNKLNLAIASGKMPDMFYTTQPALFSQLLESEKLADLSSYFYTLNDELLENYLDDMPEILPTVMRDSKVYALPMLSNKYTSAQRLYIRKDWLDIVGMSAPTTIEEMIRVGQAFLDKKQEIAAASAIDAKRVIPFTMQKEITWAGSYSAEGMFNAHGASIGSYFDDGKGSLISSTTSAQSKNALGTLRQMFEVGILDKDFTSKTAEQIQANIKAGYVGMVFGEWWLPKDALDDNIRAKTMADWTWVDIPSYNGQQSNPVVKRVSVSGYNLVSSTCAHPEAIFKLINLFYDVYYSDDAALRYVDDKGNPLTLPSNGFYYQYVPVKLWDGVASNREYKRVQSVFEGLYNAGFYSNTRLRDGITEDIEVTVGNEILESDYIVTDKRNNGKGKVTILKRSIVDEIKANESWLALFNTLKNREKILHFADGYPYFVAMKQGVTNNDMTENERLGWGIYHEMISATGTYAYVVELTEGTKKAKYDEFYGPALNSMEEFGEYLNTQVNSVFTQIITGQKELSYFDEFVANYNKNGGDKILQQVNEWYKQQPKVGD